MGRSAPKVELGLRPNPIRLMRLPKEAFSRVSSQVSPPTVSSLASNKSSKLSNSRQPRPHIHPTVVQAVLKTVSSIRRYPMAAIAPLLAMILILALVFRLAKWSAYRKK